MGRRLQPCPGNTPLGLDWGANCESCCANERDKGENESGDLTWVSGTPMPPPVSN